MPVSTRTPEVRGVREAMKTLREIDPRLRRESAKSIRTAAQPLVNAARSKVPGSPPLSGWTRGRYAFNGTKAKRGVKAKVGGRARKSSATWDLVTLIQADAGGAVYDMAGRRSAGKSPQGRAFISGLKGRGGGASRTLWPAAEEQLPAVQSAVEAAVREVVAKSMRELQ